MEEGWWYANGEDRSGPLSATQMLALMQAGTIGPQTLVWRPGRLAWKPLVHVTDFLVVRVDPGVRPEQGEAAQRHEPPFADPLRLEQPAELHPTSPAPQDLPSWAKPELEPAAGAHRTTGQAVSTAGPWRRFFAQVFDSWTLCWPAGYLVGLVGAKLSPEAALWLSSPQSNFAAGLLTMPVTLVVQAIIFGLFATTPGKFVFGIRVTNADGSRPTFLQYLRRMVGLYWYGLGLCFPLVTLFTMGHQYGKVKAGRPTTYDARSFSVTASEMGPARTLAAIVSSMALVIGMVHLTDADRQLRNAYFTGFEWTNPETGRVASVPSGWVYSKQRNEEGAPYHLFTSDRAGVVVVFAGESAPEVENLEEYHRLWVAAVRPALDLDTRPLPVNVKGRFGLQAKGVMVKNSARRVNATLVKSGDEVWRVVLVGTAGREPETRETEKLRNVLFQTLAPDGPGPQKNAI